MSNPGSNWHRLNDVYYRTRELSNNIDTISSTAADSSASPLSSSSTPTAISHSLSQQRLQHLQSLQISISPISKNIAIYLNGQIELYDSNYQLLNVIINPQVKGLHWWGENLVIVEFERLKVYYDYVGRQFHEFEIKVHETRQTEQFFVILDQFNQIWYIKATKEVMEAEDEINYDYVEPVFKISKLGGQVENIVNNLCVIPTFTFFKVLKNQGSVLSYGDGLGVTGNFRFVQPSFNSQFIATYSFDNELTIYNALLQHQLLTKHIDQPPESIEWCGSDSVILRYKDYLNLVAPGGELSFYFSSDILSIANTGQGLIILTSTSIELLSKVDQETVNLFKIGSISNSSILLNSFDLLQNHNPKSFQNLKYIPKEDLLNCINDCLHCALTEFEPYWQKKLTKAANLGKSIWDLNTQGKNDSDGRLNDLFEKYITTIQVLNQLRNIGVFITVNDLKEFGIECALRILNKRKLFKLAFQVTKALKHSVDKVFQDWCILKIKSIEFTDEEIFTKIKTKYYELPHFKNINLKPIFKECFNESRTKLFELLTSLEVNPVLQNLNYFKLEKWDVIVANCLNLKDLDLLQLELTKISTTLPKAQFLKLMGTFPGLCFIYQYLLHLKSEDKSANEEIQWLLTNDRFKQYINLKIQLQPSSQETLAEALRIYQTDPVDSRLISRHTELLQFQESLIAELQISPEVFPTETNSIINTLKLLISLNLTHKITQFAKKFNISREKLNYYRLQNFIRSGNEEDLVAWLKTNPTFPLSSTSQNFLINSKLSHQVQLQILSNPNYNINYTLKLNKFIDLKEFALALKLAFKEGDDETCEELVKLDPPSLEVIYQELMNEGRSGTLTSGIKKFNFFQ